MADQSDRNCVVPAHQGMTPNPYKSSQLDISLRGRSAMAPGLFECISRWRSAWCRNTELSDPADSDTTKEAPPWRVFITLGSMFTRKQSVTACKMAAAVST